MIATKQEQKEKAIELLQTLDIYKPYINGFKSEAQKVCFYENFSGFWAYQEPFIADKIKEIETKHNCTIYAITHEFTEFGELYDFLVVPQYKEDWDYILQKANKGYYAFAYVWNTTDDFSSEFGDIGVISFGGGIKRVA